jgi:anti-sigma factor ChrR (cupin superfamily)
MTIDFGDLEVPLAKLAAGEAVAPRPEVRDRLMAGISAEPPDAPDGFSFNMAAEFDKWLQHPVPGIRVRVLSLNHDRGYATLFLDVAPGTRFPPHHHAGAEECYVVSGSLFTWGRRLGPGDFVHADSGTEHSEMWTEEGCQVVLVEPITEFLTEHADK